jgi:hypothetical protein
MRSRNIPLFSRITLISVFRHLCLCSGLNFACFKQNSSDCCELATFFFLMFNLLAYSNKILQQIYSFPVRLNDETNLFCGKLFHPRRRTCTVISSGFQHDRFSYSPLCSLVATIQSLKGVSDAVCWRTNIPKHNVSHSGRALYGLRTASINRIRIVDCSCAGGLYAFILCLCCQRYCGESILDLRIPTKPSQTRFRNTDDGNHWVIFAPTATTYIVIGVQPLL